jgi:glycine/D-amino acid oxidase-like deaminating enzyme
VTGPAPRVAVIGAGIIGSAVARQFALHGAEVWLLDRDDRADATTRVSFAWLNAHRKREPDYHRLNVAGMAEHHALAAELDPHRRWHFPTGHLEYATGPDHADRLAQDVEALRELDYPARWVSREWAQAHEPWVRVPESAEAAFFASEGFVLPGVLNDALIDHARALGVDVGLHSEVFGIADHDTHVSVVRAGFPQLRVDQVVICAGRWTERLTAGLGLPVPLVAADGPASAATAFQARTAPLPIDITGVVTTSAGNFRPDVGGRVVFQAHDLDAEADPNTPAPAHVTEEMQRRLSGILRTAGQSVEVESATVGKRALPVDGVPIAGYVDPRRAVYAVATHSGVTLGPLLGRLVAEEVLTGRKTPLLQPFRPDRFVDREVAPVEKSLVQGGD